MAKSRTYLATKPQESKASRDKRAVEALLSEHLNALVAIGGQMAKDQAAADSLKDRVSSARLARWIGARALDLLTVLRAIIAVHESSPVTVTVRAAQKAAGSALRQGYGKTVGVPRPWAVAAYAGDLKIKDGSEPESPVTHYASVDIALADQDASGAFKHSITSLAKIVMSPRVTSLDKVLVRFLGRSLKYQTVNGLRTFTTSDKTDLLALQHAVNGMVAKIGLVETPRPTAADSMVKAIPGDGRVAHTRDAEMAPALAGAS